MKRRTIIAFFTLALFAFAAGAELQAQNAPKPDPIAPPVLVAPMEGAKINIYPRKTVFEWRRVDGASKYEIEIEANEGKWKLIKNEVTTLDSYTFDFVGKQAGRWRVRSFSKATGKAGVYTPWREFLYLR
jgi:hypothetical protein